MWVKKFLFMLLFLVIGFFWLVFLGGGLMFGLGCLDIGVFGNLFVVVVLFVLFEVCV